MMRRPFLPCHIGQIRCLFPQAYSFSWEKPTRGGSNGDLELQICPNLRYKKALLDEFDKDGNVHEKMLTEHQVERRGMFHNVLVQLVKDHHSDFLKTLDPPITVVDSKITAWHKEFDVDSCPDIDTISLPKNPNEVKIGASEDMQARLNSVMSNDKEQHYESSNNDKTVKFGELTPVKEALSSLPPALLAKIRAKEAAKAVQLMTRSPENIARIKQLKRLPELARMTRNLLIQEKKAALTVEFTCRKLVEGVVPKTDKVQVEGDLRAMCVETKSWMTVHKVGQTEYFKVGKTDINKVCERLERKLKELEEK